MLSPSELAELKVLVRDIRHHLPTQSDEDARMLVGMMVTNVFRKHGALTPEVADLVEFYYQLMNKRQKPDWATKMAAFVAARGTTEP